LFLQVVALELDKRDGEEEGHEEELESPPAQTEELGEDYEEVEGEEHHEGQVCNRRLHRFALILVYVLLALAPLPTFLPGAHSIERGIDCQEDEVDHREQVLVALDAVDGVREPGRDVDEEAE